MANRSTKKNVVQVHWVWIILAVMAVAIPLTVYISSQPTNLKQFAAEKNRGHNNNKNNNKNGNDKTAGEDTNRWIPGGKIITVEDYTNPNIWSNFVELKINQWNAILRGGASLSYVRKPFTYCENLPSSITSQPNAIIVCSTPAAKSYYGATTWYLYPSGALLTSIVELVDQQAGNEVNKINTACHELGHAMGIRHNNSSQSCVNTNGKLQHPGEWDENTLKKSYGGTVSDTSQQRMTEVAN